MRVLGIDTAFANWSSIGSATVEFDPSTAAFTRVETASVVWPDALLTATELADAIDAFARANRIAAVSIDGPQGWRDPNVKGDWVGRQCEHACKTPSKTGVSPATFPRNQYRWIEFCIDLFTLLIARPNVMLANIDDPRLPRSSGYIVLECFPTSAWRSSGLAPLPRKSKRPNLFNYCQALSSAYTLPTGCREVTGHDDLQALVAALTAAAVVGGPLVALPKGLPATIHTDADGTSRRIEGIIWDIQPSSGPVASARVSRRKVGSSRQRAASSDGGASVRVTQRVMSYVARAGIKQAQIALRDVAGGTRDERRRIRLQIGAETFELWVGDSSAIWLSHQDSKTLSDFERLFGVLAQSPDAWKSIIVL